MPAQLTTDINKMIKSSYGRNLKRLELLNDSENNLNVKCSNENCTIQGTFKFLDIVQNVLHIFVTDVVILVRTWSISTW